MRRIMETIFTYIIQNISEQITLDELAYQAGFDRFKFLKTFREEYNITPMKWLWKFRIHLAAEVMKMNPHMSITETAFLCGFSSSSHFCRVFKKEYKRVPTKFCSNVKSTRFYFKMSPSLISEVITSTRYPITMFTLEETLRASH